jgi:L-2-hydroxyglutarate oxidase
VVVAVTEEERPYLEELERRGAANGLQGLRRLDRGALQELEPFADGVAGLHVPDTGIVDFAGVAQAYAEAARQGGAVIRTGARVEAVHGDAPYLRLVTASGEVSVRHLINCAGLQSDRVARMCGLRPDIQIIPFRGEYYKLVAGREELCRNLIYPVPDPRFPFLGVHFTRVIGGGVEVGPNAVLAFKREGYVRFSFSLGDTWDTLRHPGFWKMARRYSRTGCLEIYRSLSKRAFVKALQELVPQVGYDDVERDGAGVRAQAVTADGALVDDFRILEAERMIHVLNAPSPAATASLSIGASVARMARTNFSLA